jgi:hypothetical protein
VYRIIAHYETVEETEVDEIDIRFKFMVSVRTVPLDLTEIWNKLVKSSYIRKS